jgi:hypothetical protein
MSEDDDEPDRPVPEKKPSLIPSWVTLGFILGALFVLALPRAERAMRAPAVDSASDGLEGARGESADVAAGEVAAGIRSGGPTASAGLGAAGKGGSGGRAGGVSAAARASARIPTIEAVFEQYGHYAVWKNDVTEVALWNADTKDFSDLYEVARMDNTYYFRSIPHLTRPVLTHGVPADCPLIFTETVEQRQQWLNDVRKENWRVLSEGARNSFGPPQGTATPPSGH